MLIAVAMLRLPVQSPLGAPLASIGPNVQISVTKPTKPSTTDGENLAATRRARSVLMGLQRRPNVATGREDRNCPVVETVDTTNGATGAGAVWDITSYVAWSRSSLVSSVAFRNEPVKSPRLSQGGARVVVGSLENAR